MPRNLIINYARIVGAPSQTPTSVTLNYIVGHYEPTPIDLNTYSPKRFSNENRSAFYITQPHQLSDNSWIVTTYTDNKAAANNSSVTLDVAPGQRPTDSEIFNAIAIQEGLDLTQGDKIFYNEDLRGT